MKVRITFVVDDRARKAINYCYGRKGMATYKEVKAFFATYGHGAIDDVLYELDIAEMET